MTTRPTSSVYRDESVEHVRTIDTGPGRCYYECSKCTARLWTSSFDALEEFLVEHDPCGE